MPCSLVVQLARVGVRVIVLIDVVCVMIVVLIAHVDVVRAVDTVFVAILVEDVLFTEYARAVNSKMRDLVPVVLSSLLPTVRALLITRGAEVTALRGNMWD